MAVQALPQPVLDGDVTGLLGRQVHHQQLEIVDAAAIVHDQLHPIIAAIHRGPHQQAGIHHQMVGQAGVALGKHHGLAAAGEILQLQHRHPITLAGCHLADFGHHHHGAHLGLVGQLFEVGQGNGGEQLHWSAQLLEGVIGEVETH